jgi:hypothetical protein
MSSTVFSLTFTPLVLRLLVPNKTIVEKKKKKNMKMNMTRRERRQERRRENTDMHSSTAFSTELEMSSIIQMQNQHPSIVGLEKRRKKENATTSNHTTTTCSNSISTSSSSSTCSNAIDKSIIT